jgi:hypothetical protein
MTAKNFGICLLLSESYRIVAVSPGATAQRATKARCRDYNESKLDVEFTNLHRGPWQASQRNEFDLRRWPGRSIPVTGAI